MQLIDRYIYAVTRHLPQDQRADVTKELKTTIEDMVIGKAGNKKPSEKQVEAALKELGDPIIFASRYRDGQKYLIGPKWFAIYRFWMIRLIVLVPLGFAVLALFGAALQESPIWIKILNALGAAFMGAIQTGFWTTLVFAILQWTETSPEAAEFAPEKWEPSQLPQLPQKNQISHVDAIAGMIFTVIFTGALALLPIVPATWIGLPFPVLNPDLAQIWVPVFIALGIVSFVQEVIKYKVGKWTPGLAALNTVICIAYIIYFVGLVVTQQVVNQVLIGWLSLQSGTDVSLVGALPVIVTVVIIVASFGWSAIESIMESRKKS